MKNLFTEVRHKIYIDYNSKIYLWPFGDVHRDTNSCDIGRWNWFRKRAKEDVENNEHTYFLGMGDYNDFASVSEQKKILRSGLHETTIEKLDGIVERDNRRFANEISFMRGRLLGMIGGNHTWQFQNAKYADEDLAERMNTKYLGWLSHYTLTVQYGKSGKSQSIHIVACHGKAGGKTFGVTINQVGDLKQIFPAADIYIMGHDHQRGAWPVSVLLPTKTRLKQKRQFLCRSGSFKKAYTPGESSYETSRLYRPADLGALKLIISFHRERENAKRDTLITDIEAVI